MFIVDNQTIDLDEEPTYLNLFVLVAFCEHLHGDEMEMRSYKSNLTLEKT